MNRLILLLTLIVSSCNTGNLKVIADLPIELNEASGLTVDKNTNTFWMINDGGNKPILYGLNKEGKIIRTIKIKAKNRDWEDLTTDSLGNIYIGNFGNNDNDSKGLSILKISIDSINANLKSIKPEIIKFNYPEQTKFPPKKKNRHFDCEAFFWYKDSLYLFTKSRAPKDKGKTNLYKLPSNAGNYKAKFISSFNTCNSSGCWVTSADINTKGDKIALLTENAVFVFSDIEKPNLLNTNYKHYAFEYNSQKESVHFKNDSTLYITDEYFGVEGGNLYEFYLTDKSNFKN